MMYAPLTTRRAPPRRVRSQTYSLLGAGTVVTNSRSPVKLKIETLALPVAAGQEMTTWSLRTGFSETSAPGAAASCSNAELASVANPTASTHQLNWTEMKRTQAPARPAASGSSTRNGYQFGPSPMILATSLHVAPESPEN